MGWDSFSTGQGGYARGGCCLKVKLGLARGKYLPAGLHAAEASYVSASSLSAFRAAIVWSVWSCKMPLANTSAVLNLLDGPFGVDRAYLIFWARFRMMRRYLACRPDEVPHIFSVCWILLLTLLRGMVQCICCLPLLLRLGLPGMGVNMSGPVSSKLALSRLKERAFGMLNSWTSEDLYNYLTLPT